MRLFALAFFATVGCTGANPDGTNETDDTDLDSTTGGGVDMDDDGFTKPADCHDGNPNINPGATEVPGDGVDNDCDPLTKDDDLDGDGFDEDDDCNDNNKEVNTGETEVPYDGLDNDCDAKTLDDDLDGDGFVEAVDCDDDDEDVNSDAVEVPYDGVDNDCDALSPDDDVDGDGFLAATDCDDNDEEVNTDGVEVVYDGADNDCDPLTLDDDLDGDGYPNATDCDDDNEDLSPGDLEVAYDGVDNDCSALTPDDDVDGDGFLKADDCDDGLKAVHPDATEVPYDGVDNDCADGDECDVDGDGALDDGLSCGGTDCDDGDELVNPSADEVTFDDLDNDCDPLSLDKPNFWIFDDPWETFDANSAEVARIYTNQPAWVVVYADDDGAPGEEVLRERFSALSEDRILLENPGVWKAHQLLHLAVYGDEGTPNSLDPSDPLLVDEDNLPLEIALDLHFVSSTTFEESPYYADTCTIEQFQENRTDLFVDCRCNEAKLFEACGDPSDMKTNDVTWAEGPHMFDVNDVGQEVGGGFVDEENREYIVAMNWKDPVYTQSVGTIWAINIDSGDRRVVSGTLNTPSGYVTTGGGYTSNVTVSDVLRHTAPLPFLWDVQPGPDGDWYAYGSDTQDNVEIVRVDPATGDRTLVWHKAVKDQGHTMGQCTSDRVGELSVQFNERSFTMDPDGNFYLSFHNSADGDGIVKIPADGSTCTVVSRIHSTTRPDVGGGYTFQSQNIRGIGWANGEIMAYTVLGDRLIGIDPTTGDRTLVSAVASPSVGDGFASMGENWLVWDEETQLLWTSGGGGDQFVAVDIVSGDRQNLLRLSSNDTLVPGGHPVEHETRGPLHPGAWTRQRFYFHPDNHDHINMVIENILMVTYEVHTSNSVAFSF